MNEQDYCNYVSDCFLQRFPNAKKTGEKILGTMGAWHVEFILRNHAIFISSDRGFLEFHVFNSDGVNLGLMNTNSDIFNDFFSLNPENIDIIINFLYDHKAEIFREE
ncbi:hypothetical protein [Maribellus sediminis]|uniref:hypothetical protein n=1 Tax=Maribellus sediminis TaxID=2696285 RepID=UPI001430790F|nr:hypothetical protein [Maribellus sediminis]